MPAKAKLTTRQESTTQVSSDNFAKGSELTYAEADSNFINLRDQSIAISDGTTTTDIEAGETITFSGATVSGNTVSITGGGGSGNLGNLQVNDTTLSPITTNDNLILTANGTGYVSILNDKLIVGTGSASFAEPVITTPSGSTEDITISTQEGNSSGIIKIQAEANQNILITPNGAGATLITNPNLSGTVNIKGISWPASDGTNGQVLTTNGAGTLSFTTISSTSTGDITFTGNEISTTSSNADLELAASGTGNIDLKSRSVFVGDSTAAPAIISTETDRDLILAQNMNLSSDFSTNPGGFINIANNGVLILRPASSNQYIHNESPVVYIGRSSGAASKLSGFGRSLTTITTNNYGNGWEPRILLTPPGPTASDADKALSKITLDAGASGSGTLEMTMIKIFMANLPTSDPVVAGQLWNDTGTLKISAG